MAGGARQQKVGESDPSLGLVLQDRYRLEERLGAGGMGVVYLARDLVLAPKRVVVKLLAYHLTQDAWAEKQFQREVEALARVNHPGVVGVLDVGLAADGRSYLVMPFVEGVTLRSHLQQHGPLPYAQAGSIIYQVGEALSVAHEKGVIHCDVKPPNVVLTPLAGGDLRATLIDFGVARLAQNVAAAGNVTVHIAGTLPYIAPERLQGLAAQPASDLFSLAVMAYEVLTGSLPFDTEHSQLALEYLRRGVRQPPSDLRPDLPKRASALIVRALAFEPADRGTAAVDFGMELARVLLEQRSGEAFAGPVPGSLELWAEPLDVGNRVSMESAQHLACGIGDRLKLYVRTSKAGYLSVFNLGTSGATTLLFPNRWRPDSYVQQDATIELPGPTDGFELCFHGPAGVERIRALLTNRPFDTTAEGAASRDVRLVLKKVEPLLGGLLAEANLLITVS